MLLGIALILIAIFIQGTQTNMMYGFEVFIGLIGAILIIGGFVHKEKD
jgi:hypothetical protein